jgi:polar amino acid transport system substrate-binding protein
MPAASIAVGVGGFMRIFRVFVALLASLAASLAMAQQQLVLNSSFSSPITSVTHNGVLDLFYAELGKRAGINFTIQIMPAERGLLNANSGVDDGDVSRVFGIDSQYTGLVRVPESVMHYQMSVFSKHSHFTVSGPESLREYDVGILTGWKILERSITASRSVVKLENPEQLFSMLDKGRIDVAVVEKLMGFYFIKTMALHGIDVMQPPFVEGEWYLYLNKKHAALVPALTAAIKSMKDDGTHQRIFADALRAYAR